MVKYTNTADYVKDPQTGQKVLNQYKLSEQLGRGTFSKVKLAVDDDGGSYAIKVFHKEVMERRQLAYFDRHGATTISLRTRIDEELRILALLTHDHVLALIEVVNDPRQERLFIVYEGLAGGELMGWSDEHIAYQVTHNCREDIVQHWGDAVTFATGQPSDQADSDSDSESAKLVLVYTEPLAWFFLRQLLEGVQYLHQQGVIHKDIKPDNVMLTSPLPCDDPRFCRNLNIKSWRVHSLDGCVEEPCLSSRSATAAPDKKPKIDVELFCLLTNMGLKAKLCDFNSAVMTEQPDCLVYDAHGTVQFTPPECFEHADDVGVQGKPRDMWSVGCMLYTMIFGCCPFMAKENILTQLMIMEGEYTIPTGVISSQGEELLRSLMRKDPAERFSADAALQSPLLL